MDLLKTVAEHKVKISVEILRWIAIALIGAGSFYGVAKTKVGEYVDRLVKVESTQVVYLDEQQKIKERLAGMDAKLEILLQRSRVR